MQRRDVLALCGAALAGMAGCTSEATDGATTPTTEPNGSASTETPTRTRTDTPTPTSTASDVALSVSVDALQPAVVQLYTDALGVSSPPNRQFLFLRIETTAGSPPARSELAFRFDGTEYGPSDAERATDLYRLYHEKDSRYDAERGAGWILFELPDTGDASDAALVWSNGEWRPDSDLEDRLAAPSPELSVEWTVPETTPLGSTPTLGFSVSNDGDHATRFVAGINRQGWKYAYIPIEDISRRIPAGETVSWEYIDTYTIEAEGGDSEAVGDGKPDLTYGLRWTGEGKQRQVRVVEG